MEINPKQETETPSIKDVERQTRHLGHRWDWVEATIWTQNMLKALDNGVKGNKWFSLIDKVYKLQTWKMLGEKSKKTKGLQG